MKINLKEKNGAVVVKIRGKLIGGPRNSEEFREVIASVLDTGRKYIVVDLGRTSWANSPGIGLLIGAYTTLRDAGGELVLASVGGRMKDVLSVTRILLMFKTFDGVDDAIEYFDEKSDSVRRSHTASDFPSSDHPSIDDITPYRFDHRAV